MTIIDRLIVWRARRELSRMAERQRQIHQHYAKHRAAGKLGHARKRGAA